jgi:hypothetical protein
VDFRYAMGVWKKIYGALHVAGHTGNVRIAGL